MLEKIVEKILNRILGSFVENFKSEQISLALLSGKVDIQDIVIKKDIMKQYGFPFKILKGTIGRVQLVIPWRQITQVPVEVSIKDVCVSLQVEEDWSSFYLNPTEKITQILFKYVDSLKASFE